MRGGGEARRLVIGRASTFGFELFVLRNFVFDENV